MWCTGSTGLFPLSRLLPVLRPVSLPPDAAVVHDARSARSACKFASIGGGDGIVSASATADFRRFAFDVNVAVGLVDVSSDSEAAARAMLRSDALPERVLDAFANGARTLLLLLRFSAERRPLRPLAVLPIGAAGAAIRPEEENVRFIMTRDAADGGNSAEPRIEGGSTCWLPTGQDIILVVVII